MGDDVNPADLLALAERCEQASGADRELDVAIVEALGWRRRGGFFSGLYWERGGKRIWLAHIPLVTASLDAAMTLLDPSWFFHLSRFSEGPPEKAANAHVYPNRALGDDYEADAATPALALTAAALRARAATLGGDK